MTRATEALPDNPDLLKAMLLAERAESERLRQIIKELQRHRFGRRAESLPEEQLQLGLEDVEQVEAAGQAESDANIPAERQERAARRRANRGALRDCQEFRAQRGGSTDYAMARVKRSPKRTAN